MRVRQILEMSMDIAFPVPETMQVMREVLMVIPNKQSQVDYLHEIRNGIDTMLKGVEVSEPLRESNAVEKDQ